VHVHVQDGEPLLRRAEAAGSPGVTAAPAQADATSAKHSGRRALGLRYRYRAARAGDRSMAPAGGAGSHGQSPGPIIGSRPGLAARSTSVGPR
jgi:hypothetical protein